MMGGGNDTTRSPKAAGGNLDEPTRRIAERLLNMPPKLHKDMKLGKSKAKDANLAFKTTQSKGRASKNET
jgi:hypothetical protein